MTYSKLNLATSHEYYTVCNTNSTPCSPNAPYFQITKCRLFSLDLGLQVTPPGLGVHWLSLPHTAVITPSGTNPGSHWNTTTEPSVVLVWGCRDPLTGGGGAPQSAIELKWLLRWLANSLQATCIGSFQPQDCRTGSIDLQYIGAGMCML